MKAYQASYPITMLCRLLEVSASGFYAWRTRPPSPRRQADSLLGDRIEAIHRQSRWTYGRPRIHADLKDEGIGVSGKRIARLMRERRIFGASRRKGTITTIRNRDARPAPDLVDRNFRADRPDQLWVADITYIPTWAGFLYLAVVLDVYSRRIVGWAMANHLRSELVLEALNMAVYRRNPSDVIHHSDQGCQYTSIAFGKRCDQAGVRPSMASVGDCYDNAMCESFNATLECELLAFHRFKNQRDAATAIFDFIEGWYNPHRRHSALGYLSPSNYERRKSRGRLMSKSLLSTKAGQLQWRLFANASAYDEYGRTAAQTPLWVYIGRVALFIGLLGAMQTRFEWNPNPLFLIMLSGGLVISVIAVKTGKLKRHNWRRK